MRRGIDFCCHACDLRLARLPSPVCARCHRYLIRGEFVCSCEDGAPPPSRIAALGLFDSAWRALVHSYKYSGGRSLARPLAGELSRRLHSLPKVDAIVAVPTALHRRRERGFGHAELLAEHLAGWSGLPFLPDAIGFTRRVADQTRLSGEERKANLDGAFKSLDPDAVQDKSILIVDDVMTTGTTMTEAGRSLLAAGAATVHGAIVALNLGQIPDGPRG